VLPHGGERLRHLVELRVVVLVVRHGGQRLGGLGVHVVEQPTTLGERHTHRDVVVEVDDELPPGSGPRPRTVLELRTDEQQLELDGPPAHAADRVHGRHRVVGATIEDDRHEGRDLHRTNGRLGLGRGTSPPAATRRKEVSVASDLGDPVQRLGEIGGATSTDTPPHQKVVEVVQVDHQLLELAIEEDGRNLHVIVHEDAEGEVAVHHRLNVRRVGAPHRAGTVDDEDLLPLLVGVELVPQQAPHGCIDLGGHEAVGSLPGVGFRHTLLDLLKVRH